MVYKVRTPYLICMSRLNQCYQATGIPHILKNRNHGGDSVKAFLEVSASKENLDQVIGFISECLEAAQCPFKQKMQLEVAAEEIFVNIASYAYDSATGRAEIEFSCEDDAVSITFADRGAAFDPLGKEDPDISLSAEERKIGGLGIFMVKKTMDNVTYRRENDRNILTIIKKIK